MTNYCILVTAKLIVQGLHHWPDATDDVYYLKDLHRHEFHIEVGKYVDGDNRSVEFIGLKNKTLELISATYSDAPNGVYNFGTLSCEQLAIFLIESLSLDWCSVKEDGENGAVVQVLP